MRTTVTLPFPFDVLAHITHILGAESDRDTLRALSLTCKFMVPLCRRYIFSSISLSSAVEKIDLIRFLHGSPNITRCIKKLEFFVEHTPTNQHILAIFQVMRRSRPTSLQSISLTSFGWSDWDVVQEPTKSLLISLIQLRTVTHVELGLMHNFPFGALALCSGLTHISVSNVSEATSHSHHNSARSKIPAPVSLNISGFHSAISILMRPPSRKAIKSIIDFSRLEKASFEISDDHAAWQMDKLLKTVTRLRTLSIEYENSMELFGLGSSLVANAYRTLASLQLKFTAFEEYDHPLCGLTPELQHIAGNNVLEELHVVVLVEVDEPCRTDSDDWSAFDVALTRQGAFPMLRRVAVDLMWYSHDRDEEEVEDLLNKLTEDQYPHLLESSAIQFKFYEQHDYV